MTETSQQAIDTYNAGLAHMRAGRLAEARSCYERAIALQPGYIRALHNLAAVLDDLGEYGLAETHYRTAISAEPGLAEPWAGLGSNLRAQGRLGEARAAFERALELRAEFPAARWNLALVDLAEGRFAEGWTNYLFRPTADRASVPLVELPDDPSGTIVELVDEQGLGDALFFLRFVPALRGRGASVRYEADPRISTIVERTNLFGPRRENSNILRVALGDLPFELNANDCPPSLRIPALADRVAKFETMLRESGPPPYRGVTWRAGQRAAGYLFKEIDVGALGNMLRPLSGTVVSVQRAPEAHEHADLERAAVRRIVNLSDHNADLEDMLALMSLLDDYIGVSNTNVHLRAAVGRTARVLVTHPAEYRWMSAGDTSPWFPGFALYRQSANGSWETALARLAGDLSR